MAGDSREVLSNQHGSHANLPALLSRRQRQPYQRRVGARSEQTFARIATFVADPRRLVLDLGCGTGQSTQRLAQRYPSHQVVGVDKSAQRLSKQPPLPTNALLAQMDAVDLMVLAQRAGWQGCAVKLLYPNPWPKSEHLARRWHAHPVMPTLLAIAGALELRTNWEIYACEMAQALPLLGYPAPAPKRLSPDQPPLTAFEAKYAASGHTLWQLAATWNSQ